VSGGSDFFGSYRSSDLIGSR